MVGGLHRPARKVHMALFLELAGLALSTAAQIVRAVRRA